MKRVSGAYSSWPESSQPHHSENCKKQTASLALPVHSLLIGDAVARAIEDITIVDIFGRAFVVFFAPEERGTKRKVEIFFLPPHLQGWRIARLLI